MRGKGHVAAPVGGLPRITPAHAGKSLYEAALEVLRKDHPRPCGEKIKDVLDFTINTGSPPPMRGKVAIETLEGYPLGITPAHAGKRRGRHISDRRRRDHPRPCGEKPAPCAG